MAIVDLLFGGAATDPKPEAVHFWLFLCGYGPLLVGVVAGAASLIYGVQHGPLGFVLGGIATLVVAVLWLLIRLGTNPWAWGPSMSAAIGLSVAYYGGELAAQFIAIAGLIVFGIAIVWGAVQRRKSCDGD